ncbi:MAG TPA: hypothetical protein VKK31_25690 [Thermoanaerobaculia bacterium]|nr:hypothetical protein [Thermoanaerobaculia bacterium]
MIAAAIHLSLEEGFAGRIGLHSLPQADKFYEGHGLINAGHDLAKQGLAYFEMNSKQAIAFLEK